MPYTINRSGNTRTADAAKQETKGKGGPDRTPGPGASASQLWAKLPFATMPRGRLMGIGAVALVLLIAWSWFIFGVGPEDSKSAMAGLTPTPAAATVPAAPAATAPTGPAPFAPAGGPAAQSAGSAPASAPQYAPQYAPQGAPLAQSPSTVSPGLPAGGTGYASGATAAPPPPAEVEGMPPVNSHAGDGSAWKPNDPAGKIITHGPANDP